MQAETSTYRSGGRTNYHAGHHAIDVLTDTTERSPTFCTPPFGKLGDHGASESMAFLLVPGSRTVDAWAGLLQRAPRCLRWSPEEVQVLLPGSNPERTAAILEGITESELMRFAIGTEGLEERALRSGDLSLTIRSDVDVSALKDHGRLDGSDHGSPAVGAVLHFTGHIEAGRPARGSTGHVPVPPAGLLLDGLTRVAVKMVLNAISTCVMVRLGRVMGNTMIYVVPSNLKLIDRATRYIVRLTGLSYERANGCLFEALEHVEPRMHSGQAYPPVVGLAVAHVREGLTIEQAEKALMARDQIPMNAARRDSR